MYDIGTHIDLTYLNRTHIQSTKKKETGKLYSVGTQFIFQFTPKGIKAAIRIPVAVA